MHFDDPFDHRPDPVLGKLLREHLDPGDSDAFAARMRRAAARYGSPSSVDLLTQWAPRVGLGAVAAAALLLLALATLRSDAGSAEPPVQYTAALGPADAPSALLQATAPEPDVLLISLLESR